MRLIHLPVFVLLVFVSSLFPGCGGGSAGTGLGTPVEGRVLLKGQPVAGATVTVLETGDSDITDTDGTFSITLTESLTTATLKIEGPGINQEVKVDTAAGGSIVNIEVDENTPPPPLPNVRIHLDAKIVGLCDSYFENRNPIRQSNEAPPGVTCTVKAEVTDEFGRAVGGVRFAVEHRACAENSDWKTDAVSETSQTYYPGTGQLQFRFFDDNSHCLYRVFAPFKQGSSQEQQVLIETFRAQQMR